MNRYVWQNVEHKLPINLNTALSNLNSATSNFSKILNIPEKSASEYSDTEFAKMLLANSNNPIEYNNMLEAFSTGSGLTDQQKVLRRNLSATAIENAFNKVPQVMENAKAFDHYMANKNMEYEIREHSDLVNNFRNAIESGDTRNATRFLDQLSKTVTPETFNAIKQDIVAVKQANANVAKTWADTRYTNTVSDTNEFNLENNKENKYTKELINVALNNSPSKNGALLWIQEQIAAGNIHPSIGYAAMSKLNTLDPSSFNEINGGLDAVNASLSGNGLQSKFSVDRDKFKDIWDSTNLAPGSSNQGYAYPIEYSDNLYDLGNTTDSSNTKFDLKPTEEALKNEYKKLVGTYWTEMGGAVFDPHYRNTNYKNLPLEIQATVNIPHDVLAKYPDKNIGDIPFLEVYKSRLLTSEAGQRFFNELSANNKIKNMTLNQWEDMSVADKDKLLDDIASNKTILENATRNAVRNSAFNEGTPLDKDEQDASVKAIQQYNANTKSIENLLKNFNDTGKNAQNNKKTNGSNMYIGDIENGVNHVKNILGEESLTNLGRVINISNNLGQLLSMTDPEVAGMSSINFVKNYLLSAVADKDKEKLLGEINTMAAKLSKEAGIPLNNLTYELAFKVLGVKDSDGEDAAIQLAKRIFTNKDEYVAKQRIENLINITSKNQYNLISEADNLRLEITDLLDKFKSTNDKYTQKSLSFTLKTKYSRLMKILQDIHTTREGFLDSFSKESKMNINKNK